MKQGFSSKFWKVMVNQNKFIECTLNILRTTRALSINFCIVQKQPFRGVMLKTFSGNMQQIYRKTPMPKCDFNKAALQDIPKDWLHSQISSPPHPRLRLKLVSLSGVIRFKMFILKQ